MSNKALLQLREVEEFLSLKKHLNSSLDEGYGEDVSGTDSGEENEKVDLGTSEQLQTRPSDFEFLRVIGKGSFGRVLLARHKIDYHIYAIKVLQKSLIIKKNETKHIMSERNVLLKNLHHPFLVGLHFSFQTLDKLYFVLDYVNGGELFFHLQKERRFSESRAQFYTAEIGLAVEYLHSNGIIYRDLKPENILLDEDGHIVLTDFGLCKEGLKGNRKTSTFCGTPEYLAPEVLRKQSYNRSVDWWCLGAVLYEMLYGLPPFYSRDVAEMYDNILNKQVRLKNTVSLPARALITLLLHKDPTKRLGSGPSDFQEIKNQEFFQNIDWVRLYKKNVQPPFVPKLENAMDISNIDSEFTSQPVPASVGRSCTSSSVQLTASVREADSAFHGFSYAPPIDITTF